MTTPQTIERHADAILRASGRAHLRHYDSQAQKRILTAIEAYGVACAEAMREAAAKANWPDVLMGCPVIMGPHDRMAVAIRALDPSAVIKGMGHG